MPLMTRTVFLLDVDNTLLDNDRAKALLAEGIARVVSAEESARFWDTYEAVRRDEDYVDLPATVERLRAAGSTRDADAIAAVLEALPYADLVYPGALGAIEAVWRVATPVIVSDGDPVFQPAKIARAGLTAAVRGNVVITVHKEQALEAVEARFPAPRYVMVDDKPDVLARVKARLGAGVTTVHVRQGHYAATPAPTPPDRSIERIAELGPLAPALAG